MSNIDKKRKNTSQIDDQNKKKKVENKEELDPKIKSQIDELNKEKDSCYSEIYSNFNRNNILRKKINELDKKLHRVCPHKWVRDYDQYEPCGPTPKMCEYCGL